MVSSGCPKSRGDCLQFDLFSQIERVATFSHDITMSEKAAEEDSAIDDGGPTRSFLSDVWNQLGSIDVGNGVRGTKGNKCALFGTNGKCLVPQSDELLQQDETGSAMCKAIVFYKAIGRILLYTIGPGRQHAVIADNVIVRSLRDQRVLRAFSHLENSTHRCVHSLNFTEISCSEVQGPWTTSTRFVIS
jgi:hypothetical protein